MPETLEEFVKRVLEHAFRHLESALKAAEKGEWDTCDFLLAIVSNDVITARSTINTKLQYVKKSG